MILGVSMSLKALLIRRRCGLSLRRGLTSDIGQVGAEGKYQRRASRSSCIERETCGGIIGGLSTSRPGRGGSGTAALACIRISG